MKMIKNRSAREWFSSFPAVILLVCVLIAGTSSYLHAEFLKIGHWLWDDYFVLRIDPVKPSCDAHANINAALDQLATQSGVSSSDEIDLLSADEPFNRDAARISLQRQQVVCQQQHQVYQQTLRDLTPAVKVFRSVEYYIAGFNLFVTDQQEVILLLLLWVCALTASRTQHHISFRVVSSRLDYYVCNSASILSHSILLIAAWSYRKSIYASGVAVTDPAVYILLIAGFASLLLTNLYQLMKGAADLPKENASWGHALLTVPLYVYMSFIAGTYFFYVEHHFAGIAIFFSQILEQAKMFLNVGLYIWVGMLLKRTQLGQLVFSVFKPWQLPPELLALVAIIVMAVPTAYTGASGIIIIAMGAVVYQELRRVGARRQLALAVTAMTGSSGVVLYPCLLVVLIAALNKEVVTDQLYAWGVNVFLLSAVIFFIMAFLTKKTPWVLASPKTALLPSLQAIGRLMPYVVIFAVIALGYGLLLGTHLNEFSAPLILPVVVLSWLVYEKFFEKKLQATTSERIQASSFEQTIREATTDTTVHIGALILLMGLSFVTGGAIGRSDIFSVFPMANELWLSMTYFLAALVVIGMIMDPFGAVVLVTGSLAPLAYKQGVIPVHFWMMTLVAFELGYLSPPVALNRLLTRQVVGDQESSLAFTQVEQHWWYRREYWLLPLAVMGITLLIVTYAPLWFLYTE